MENQPLDEIGGIEKSSHEADATRSFRISRLRKNPLTAGASLLASGIDIASDSKRFPQ